MNRPTNASCWIVYFTDLVDGNVVFLRSPRSMLGEMYFGLANVEPFLTEEDAVAWVLKFGTGGVIEVMKGERDREAAVRTRRLSPRFKHLAG